MIKLDENLLVELGLSGLPKDEKTAFLKHMYETLEMRVGTRLAERMTDDQMAEFEQFINGNTEFAVQRLDAMRPGWRESEDFQKQLKTTQTNGSTEAAAIAEFGAFTWLETNFPTYRDVVAEEFEKLKGEIKPMAPQIAAASQAQAAQSPPPQANDHYAPPAPHASQPASNDQDYNQPPRQ